MSAHDEHRERSAGYPLILDLAGRDVLLVGGGRVAARKAVALLEAGASLRVVSPSLGEDLRARHEAGEITWLARTASPDDVAGAALVVCAASDRDANAAVAARARSSCVPAVVADDPGAGSASIPASIRRGPLLVTVSSGRTSPSLAAFVRRGLESELGPEFADLAELAARMRGRARAAGLDASARERAAAATLPRLLELLRTGRRAEAERLADEAPVEVEVLGWS